VFQENILIDVPLVLRFLLKRLSCRAVKTTLAHR